MTFDHAATARRSSHQAGAHTRRAQKDAEEAARWYRLAGNTRIHAGWLALHPDLWTIEADVRFTPGELDGITASYAALGDTYLRSSYHSTGMAAFYRELAGRYREMAAAQQNRLTSV